MRPQYAMPTAQYPTDNGNPITNNDNGVMHMANINNVNGTENKTTTTTNNNKDKRSPSKDDIIIHTEGLSLPVFAFVRLIQKVQDCEELNRMAESKKAKEEAVTMARQAIKVMESNACFTQADIDDKKKDADNLDASIEGLNKSIDKKKELLGLAFANYEESKNQAMHIMDVLPSIIAETDRAFALFGAKTKTEGSEESKTEEVKEEETKTEEVKEVKKKTAKTKTAKKTEEVE